MKTFVYYSKTDKKCEPIGRVMATSLSEAREFVALRKQLTVDMIVELFVIKELSHENSI
jgi:hypothetical protein